MDNEHVKQKFNKRAFVSILSACVFFTLPVSGLMMHRMREANDAFSYHAWMGAHNIFAVLFLVIAIIHIKLNWQPLKSYFRSNAAKAGRFAREAVLALAVVLVFAALTAAHSLWG